MARQQGLVRGPRGATLLVPAAEYPVYATARCAGKAMLSPPALTRVRAYIDAHLSEAITLADLAAAACISRFHFARLFRESTGSSPMQYVRQRRVAQAQTLLADSTCSIGTIALDLGFFDHSHFTRTFRRLTGVPPQRFMRSAAPG